MVALAALLLTPMPIAPLTARAPAACGRSSRFTRMQADFRTLLATEGVESCIAIAGVGSDRGAVTARAVDAGEVVLRVPRSLLITADRSGAVSGLASQSSPTINAAGDLRRAVEEAGRERGATWDVRLAVALYDATVGCGGPFWDEYSRLLPPPPYLATPVCLPPALRAELHDPPLEARAIARAALLDELYPGLADRSAHPVTAACTLLDVPTPLAWCAARARVVSRDLAADLRSPRRCYALVISRCLAMSDGETFAIAPFIDMCQHAAFPSETAYFQSDDDGFILTALRPLEQAGRDCGGD